MVLSKISENISYTEEKSINENDKGRNVSLFKISLYEVPIIIALGDVKYNFVKENVLYCNVYLVIDTTDKIYQIGVYEFLRDDFDKIQDEDGDINIAILDGPLLYSFVTKEFIEKCMVKEVLLEDDSGDEEEEEEEEEEEDELEKDEDDEEVNADEEDDDDEDKSNLKNSPILVELGIEGNDDDDDDFLQKGETEKDDKKIKKKYVKKSKSDASWIQSFFNNNNYTITDNDGGGDCLFYTVRDAFKNISIKTSVEDLRTRLSNKIDETQYEHYKEHYEMYNKELKTLIKQRKLNIKEKKILTSKFNDIKKKVKVEKDAPTRKKYLRDVKTIKKNHTSKLTEIKNIDKEMSNAKEMMSEFKWMKNINSVDDLKQKIKTCDFWADSWAINTLEELINTKIIVLSSDNYNHGLYNNVISCSDMVSHEIEKKGIFKPKYYIIVEHTGNHYKLIGYKDLKIFRFHQIPWSIKNEIVKKCLKTDGKNIYHFIPKFAKLVGKTVIQNATNDGEAKSEAKNESKDTSAETKIKLKTIPEEDEEYSKKEMSQTPTPKDDTLYDPETVFMFYSGSAHKPPGKGTGEKITKEKMIEFNELAKTKNWRKILSNFHTKSTSERPEPLFELDGLKWASVEHYYHANKFKKNNPDYYKLFSIDSSSEIMGDPRKALGAGGKTGKIKGKKYRPNDVVMDEDFFDDKNNERVMERGQQAKYEQDELSKKVLLDTKDAKLIHYVRSRKPKDQRPPPQVFYNSMRIRHRLKKKN